MIRQNIKTQYPSPVPETSSLTVAPSSDYGPPANQSSKQLALWQEEEEAAGNTTVKYVLRLRHDYFTPCLLFVQGLLLLPIASYPRKKNVLVRTVIITQIKDKARRQL